MQFRPTRMEVSLENLKSNYRAMREWAGPRVQTIAVLKANAYGTGMIKAAGHSVKPVPKGFQSRYRKRLSNSAKTVLTNPSS